MPKTKLTTDGVKFRINGKLTYQEIEGSNPDAHGLLMNARFIQGVFDDKAGRQGYARFGAEAFDPELNTNQLIESLPEWYKYGMRAITVGFQGGGPCFTRNNDNIDNNPFGEDGRQIDPAYLARMKRLIDAADELGMIIIVSCFYGAQAMRIADDRGIMLVVKNVANWLRDQGFTNVIIEVANEHTVPSFRVHPILYSDTGVVELMEIARRESGGMLVGCSEFESGYSELVAKNSDVMLIHGNGQTRQGYYKMIRKFRNANPNVPIVCNECSQAVSRIDVALKTQTSWGYYNNMTKQEPPINWGITKGEDFFFAHRMAKAIGIRFPEIPFEEQYYLQGLEPEMTDNGKRWVRLASLYPESIDYVDFYRNDELIYTSYDEPFSVNFRSNWQQDGIDNLPVEARWRAEVHLVDGRVLTYKQTV